MTKANESDPMMDTRDDEGFVPPLEISASFTKEELVAELDAAVRKREKWYGRAPQKVPSELKLTSKGPRT